MLHTYRILGWSNITSWVSGPTPTLTYRYLSRIRRQRLIALPNAAMVEVKPSVMCSRYCHHRRFIENDACPKLSASAHRDRAPVSFTGSRTGSDPDRVQTGRQRLENFPSPRTHSSWTRCEGQTVAGSSRAPLFAPVFMGSWIRRITPVLAPGLRY